MERRSLRFVSKRISEKRLAFWTAIFGLAGAIAGAITGIVAMFGGDKGPPHAEAITVVQVEPPRQQAEPALLTVKKARTPIASGPSEERPPTPVNSSFAECQHTVAEIIREAEAHYDQGEFSRALGRYRCAYEKSPFSQQAKFNDEKLREAFGLRNPSKKELETAAAFVHDLFQMNRNSPKGVEP